MSNTYFKVSIIVPVKNTSVHLKKCLDSLVYQTIESLQIVVVDDASDENISCFLNQNYPCNSNITYLRNEISRGPGGARNRGITVADGEYIGFLDSDDWVDLNLYEAAVVCMEQHDADIGMFSMIREVDNPPKDKFYKCQYNQFYSLSGDMAIRIMTREYALEFDVALNATNKLYRKNFLANSKLEFEEDIYFQSAPFMLNAFLHTDKIVCIPEVKYRHYRRRDSIVQSFDEKHIRDYAASMCAIKKHLEDSGKYPIYSFHYYKLCERYLNVLVREIFQFVPDENKKKHYLRQALDTLKTFVNIEEYFVYANAEQIRRHIQPEIEDTTLK